MYKLRTLNEFTDDVEDYVNESKNAERGLKLIFAYNDFLNQEIKEEMFIGENPLFQNFIKCKPGEAIEKGIEKSFYNFGKDEFHVCFTRKSGNEKAPYCINLIHLKTVNDFAGKVDDCNSLHTVYGWTNV